jgi:hypothetical protein
LGADIDIDICDAVLDVPDELDDPKEGNTAATTTAAEAATAKATDADTEFEVFEEFKARSVQNSRMAERATAAFDEAIDGDGTSAAEVELERQQQIWEQAAAERGTPRLPCQPNLSDGSRRNRYHPQQPAGTPGHLRRVA